MIRGASLLPLVVLVACGASHPSASPSAVSFAAEHTPEAPDAAVASTEPDAGPPEIDLTAGPRPFFVALCEHAASGDDAWIGRHLSAKLRGSIATRAKNVTMLAALGPDPDAARRSLLADDGSGSSLCAWLARGSISGSQQVDFFVRGSATRGFDASYRFVLDLAGPRPQLAELAFELRKRPLPATAKKAPFTIEGSIVDPSADAATTAALATLVGAVQAHPQCIYEEAARAPSSPVLAIEATRTDGTHAAVHLFPTTQPVSASLLACLETQLTLAANEKLKAPRFAVEGVLHVSVDPKTIPAKSFSFSGQKPP